MSKEKLHMDLSETEGTSDERVKEGVRNVDQLLKYLISYGDMHQHTVSTQKRRLKKSMP